MEARTNAGRKLGLALIGVLAVVAGGALYGSAAPEETGAPEPQALPVDVVTVRHLDGYPVRATYAGRVVSRRSSELGFERGGRVESVGFDQGQRVEAGQVLARLDTRALRAQRRETEARIREIGARLSLARVTAERRQQLHDAGHLSPQELDESRFQVQALSAERAAARAALENIDVGLELSEIRAPYAGSLTARHVDEGTVVSPGQPILELIEDRELEVRIGVPPELAAELEVGSRHPVQVEGRSHGATLHAVLAQVEPDTRTVAAIFHLDGAPPVPRHGALARVELGRRIEARGFWLPLSALAESRRGLWSAYVVEGEGEATHADRRQLQVIHPEAERAFVRGTLRDGERVVASGVQRLVPGVRVRVLPRN